MFQDIVQDIEIAMNQYGEPNDHRNAQARSRFLAPLFNRTVALFKSIIRNTPKSTSIPGRDMTTQGRVEYRFLLFGELLFLVLQVKFVLGTNERLDAIAHIIAECDACDFTNDRPSPIYAILCDGTSFEFFSFDGNTSPPTFSRGVFRTPNSNSKPFERLSLADYHASSDIDYIRSLRPICEVLFYLLLLTYKAGVQASMLRSMGETPGWREADNLASGAISHAMKAAVMATFRDSAADEETQVALECLQQSLEAIPAIHKKSPDLICFWDEEKVEHC